MKRQKSLEKCLSVMVVGGRESWWCQCQYAGGDDNGGIEGIGGSRSGDGGKGIGGESEGCAAADNGSSVWQWW